MIVSTVVQIQQSSKINWWYSSKGENNKLHAPSLPPSPPPHRHTFRLFAFKYFFAGPIIRVHFLFTGVIIYSQFFINSPHLISYHYSTLRQIYFSACETIKTSGDYFPCCISFCVIPVGKEAIMKSNHTISYETKQIFWHRSSVIYFNDDNNSTNIGSILIIQVIYAHVA